MTHDASDEPITVEPMRVDMNKVTLGGVAVWTVALIVILVVPSLRSGERSWWPWTPVFGIALGLIGYFYVRRGRGNASAA